MAVMLAAAKITLMDLPNELLTLIAENIEEGVPQRHIHELNAFARTCQRTEEISRPMRYAEVRALLDKLDNMDEFHKQAIKEYTKYFSIRQCMRDSIITFMYKENLMKIAQTIGKQNTTSIMLDAKT